MLVLKFFTVRAFLIFGLSGAERMRTESFCSSELHSMYGPDNLVLSPRRGYLGSTLLTCRVVARPHIELEICIKSFYCRIKQNEMTGNGTM